MAGARSPRLAGPMLEERLTLSTRWDVRQRSPDMARLPPPDTLTRSSAARNRRAYWSLNIAIAVPPAVTLTLRVFVAPEGGLQLTE